MSKESPLTINEENDNDNKSFLLVQVNDHILFHLTKKTFNDGVKPDLHLELPSYNQKTKHSDTIESLIRETIELPLSASVVPQPIPTEGQGMRSFVVVAPPLKEINVYCRDEKIIRTELVPIRTLRAHLQDPRFWNLYHPESITILEQVERCGVLDI